MAARPLPAAVQALVVITVVVASAAAADAGQAAVERPTWVRGEIIVALHDTITEPADVLVAHGIPFARASIGGDDTLDRVSRRHGLRGVRALLGAPLGPPEQVGTGALARRRGAAARRFRARTRGTGTAAPHPDLVHVYVFQVAADAPVDEVAAAYRAAPDVRYAHPNYVYRARATPLPAVTVVPDDPFIEDPTNPGFWREGSWGLALPDLWGLERVHALEAWNLFPDPIGDPGRGVLVAVVDSGLDYLHPDIAPNVWSNPGEIAGNGIDDDGNGYPDDVRGWDFTTSTGCNAANAKAPDADPMDDHGHGTHVAGTIAARADNGLGIAGIAPRATILPVKGLDDGGCGALSGLAAAIVYAADLGADVMNFSWGAVGIDPPALEDALANAHASGALMVAAAGNGVENTLQPEPHSPGTSSFVITVSALDPADRRTFFSNFGPRIDLGAPGGGLGTPPPAFKPHWNVLSLRASGATIDPQATVAGSYVRLGGTSMAAPHVAGVAALVRSLRPGFDNEDVRQVLVSSADDVGPAGFDLDAGYGRPNAERALRVVSVPRAFITSPANRAHILRQAGAPIPIVGTAAGPGFARYQVFLAAGNPPGAYAPLGPATTVPVTNGVLATWNPTDTAAYPAGWYHVLLRVTDAAGGAFESRRAVILLEPSAPDALPGWPVTDADPTFGVNAVAVGDVGPPAGTEVITAGMSLVQAWSVRGDLLWSVDVPVKPTSSYPQPVPSLGDLDGDGDLEVVVGSGSGLRVIDDGIARVIGTDEISDAPVIVDDLRGDCVPWLVTMDQQRRLHVRDPSGGAYSAAWPMEVVPPDAPVPTAESIATGDLDGDGQKEIVAALAGVVHAIGLDGTIRWTYPATSLRDPGIPNVVLGDLDHDGWLETTVVTPAATVVPPAAVTVLAHDGSVRTTWPIVGARFLEKPNATLSDLDGDGDLEIVLAAYSTLGQHVRLYAWHHTGVAVGGFPYDSAADVPEPSLNPMAADVSGDGRPDLVSSLAGRRADFDTNALFAWSGDGTLLPGWPRPLARVDPFPFALLSGTGVPATVLTDLDGDGVLDLVSPIGRNEVHAIRLGVPVAVAALDWPMHRHDVGRTGRYSPASCDDSNPCTTDQCDAQLGCGHSPAAAGTPCSDNNACTVSDQCDGSGTCVPGSAAANCDDANVCTTDSCDPATGCVHTCNTGVTCGTLCGNTLHCTAGGGGSCTCQ